MTRSESVDLAGLSQAIDSLAAGVAQRLTGLRRELEPARGLWTGPGVALDPVDEWTLAADGILGPDGVLSLISGAIRHEWPGYAGAGWSDPGAGGEKFRGSTHER